jgi:hypothetical protein
VLQDGAHFDNTSSMPPPGTDGIQARPADGSSSDDGNDTDDMDDNDDIVARLQAAMAEESDQDDQDVFGQAVQASMKRHLSLKIEAGGENLSIQQRTEGDASTKDVGYVEVQAESEEEDDLDESGELDAGATLLANPEAMMQDDDEEEAGRGVTTGACIMPEYGVPTDEVGEDIAAKGKQWFAVGGN